MIRECHNFAPDEGFPAQCCECGRERLTLVHLFDSRAAFERWNSTTWIKPRHLLMSRDDGMTGQ